MYAYPRLHNLLYPARVLFGEGPLSRSGPFGGQSESWPDRGAPGRSMAWWLVERWEALRLALGARGALPREVGTLIPPPRVPIGALAPPTAPHPRAVRRGTRKPRTHGAARTQNHVPSFRGACALARANPESRCDSAQHFWIPGSRPKRARPGMTKREVLENDHGLRQGS